MKDKEEIKDYTGAFGVDFPREADVSDSPIEFAYKYLVGDGVEKDLEKAFKILFDEAEGADNPKAMLALAVICFVEGRDPGMTVKEGYFWIKRAAESGYAPAQYQVGRFFLRGIVVPQNYQSAIQWFEKAAEQGDSRAENALGCMYAKGETGETDPDEAFIWFERSAKHQYGCGISNLAEMYYLGCGTKKDEEFGIGLYRIAANMEESRKQARQRLSELGVIIDGEIPEGVKDYIFLV